MGHIEDYIKNAAVILERIDKDSICAMINILKEVKKDKGRLFFLGVGGSAANCSHAVNDFRKICGIESYTPVDNVAELTARTNDEGWGTVFEAWLKGSFLTAKDCVFVFSVGGGDRERGISVNIVNALEYAKSCKAKVIGVVGREGGFTAGCADACVIVPPVDPEAVTPHTEAFHMLVSHLIVCDPGLMSVENKWESTVNSSS